MQEEILDENKSQRNPAPLEGEEKSKKPQRNIRWGKLILSLSLALVLFFCGYLTCWSMLDPEMRTLISVKKRIDRNYYKDVTDEEFYRSIFGGLNDDLLDDYSRYMTPEEFEATIQDMEGNRSGVGLVFVTSETDELRINRVCGNSPAEKAGLKAGERIIGYGESAENITPCKKFEEFSKFLEGYGENEELFVKVSGATERVVALQKQAYVENYLFYRTNSRSLTFFNGEGKEEISDRGEPMTYLDDDTAYIRLVQFTGSAAIEFDYAMEQFKTDGKKHLVLDLRGNGGGYLDTMQSIASYFCKSSTSDAPVVAIADFGDKKEKYRAYGNYYHDYFAEDSRVCVLADSGSASASECLIGCMLDYQAVGYGDICLATRGTQTKTFGKGIMQETYILNYFEQNALKLTTAEIRWPVSNTSIHDRGVLATDGTKTVAENLDFEAETRSAIEELWK